MTDQGAIESIAKAALKAVLGTEDGGTAEGDLPAAEIARLLTEVLPQCAISTLAADGYTVVRTNRFAENVEWIDAHLDRDVAARYRDQPLAQDWARCAKVIEEAGEAISELIAITGQNPRKGVYSTEEKLLDELADTALSGIYAIQHFTKDVGRTLSIVTAKAAYHRQRIEPVPEGSEDEQ